MYLVFSLNSLIIWCHGNSDACEIVHIVGKVDAVFLWNLKVTCHTSVPIFRKTLVADTDGLILCHFDVLKCVPLINFNPINQTL